TPSRVVRAVARPIADARPLNESDLSIEGTAIDSAQKLQEVDRIIETHRCSGSMFGLRDYYEGLTSGIVSRPEDLIGMYSTARPSRMTFQNWGHVSGHFWNDEFCSVNLFGKRHDELQRAVRAMTTAHPDVADELHQELDLFFRFRQKAFAVESAYLNSLDVPFRLLSLYPTAEPERDAGGYLSDLIGRASGERSNSHMRPLLKQPFVLRGSFGWIPDLVIEIGMLLPTRLMSLGARMCINQMTRCRDSFIPLSEGDGRQRFWLYFKYHPSKDIAPDLADDAFNPCPNINPDYHPRRMLKEKVRELYRSMDTLRSFYLCHDLPLHNQQFLEAVDNLCLLNSDKVIDDGKKEAHAMLFKTRAYALERMKSIDDLALNGC
ncbi:MAG: hypothetical protein AABY13_01095, partial [Nanoarchaeota archaeon]